MHLAYTPVSNPLFNGCYVGLERNLTARMIGTYVGSHYIFLLRFSFASILFVV